MDEMKILIAGTGAVGGLFGAQMLKGGLDATFLARGRTLAALHERGLVLRTDHGEEVLNVVASDDPAGLFDLAFVAVKSQDTERIAGSLRCRLAPGASVLTVQNGIGNEEKLARLLPDCHVLAGVAYIAVDSPEPGVVVQTRLAKILLGELDGGPSDKALRVESVLKGAGLDIRAEPDMRRRKWSKLAWNAGFNGVTALTGLGTGDAAVHPEASKLIATVMEEVVSVASAEGVKVSIDSAESLRWTSVFKGVRTSMLQDVEKGRPLELDAIYGEVARRAEAKGVPIPATTAVHRLLAALDKVRSAPPRQI